MLNGKNKLVWIITPSMFYLFTLQILDILELKVLDFWQVLELSMLEYCIVLAPYLMCWDLLLVMSYFDYVL